MRQRNVKNKKIIIENSDYYISEPNDYLGKWSKAFKNSNPIEIEIGTGKGKFIIEKALRNPDINFIGIEKSDSILALALKKIPEGLNNLKMLRLDAKEIDSIFKKEISTIYLNFSDPWPKNRHEKRRLTSEVFLKKYDSIFKNKAHIIMKTDNKDLFSYSIKSLNNAGYYIENITFDLESLNDSENIKTEYEEKFTKLGNSIYRIEVTKVEK